VARLRLVLLFLHDCWTLDARYWMLDAERGA